MPSAVLILLVAAGLALVMALAWVMQRQTANAGWVDVFWTIGTGLAGIAFALTPVGETPFTPTARQVVIAVLCAIWAMRLALHLAVRVARGAEDPRYHNIRERWAAGFEGRFFWFLQLPGALCFSARHRHPRCRTQSSAADRPVRRDGGDRAAHRHRRRGDGGSSASPLQGRSRQPRANLRCRALGVVAASELLLLMARLGGP